jgi:hypothetical protein
MKRSKFLLTIASAALLTVYSCGGGESTDETTDSSVSTDETMPEDNMDSDETSAFDYTSAEDAVDAYSEMMEEYERLLSIGDESAAELYLEEINSLENFINSSFAEETELLQNMMDMSESILNLEQDYLNAVMEGMENIPGMEEAQDEMNKAMEDAQKQMEDAMKGF